MTSVSIFSLAIADLSSLYLSSIILSFSSFSLIASLLSNNLIAICWDKFEGEDVVLLKNPWVFSKSFCLKVSSWV